jgi:hypothetical protein
MKEVKTITVVVRNNKPVEAFYDGAYARQFLMNKEWLEYKQGLIRYPDIRAFRLEVTWDYYEVDLS